MTEPARDDTAAALARLEDVLRGLGRIAVAVSGGVDSMTLGHVAHRVLGGDAEMCHAVSPAVPPEATARVRRHGGRSGWRLTVLDAHELEDPDYRRNPSDRCFYCKRSLYAALARHTDAVLVSGTNLDDLEDYRPGLVAARAAGVRHPFVEARLDKASVRALARHLSLAGLAELPASPCLASRIETGIEIRPAELGLVHAVETLVREELAAATVRCRVRRGGVTVELDEACYAGLSAPRRAALGRRLAALVSRRGFGPTVGFAPYRRGSAFLVRGAPERDAAP